MYGKTTGLLPVYIAYPELVNITKDMVNLYGEDVYLDAMMNGSEKLEQLMAKDGKSFTEFMELADDHYRIVYNNKEKKWFEVQKEDKTAKESYLKIGQFIEDIKKTRGIENIPTEWKNSDYLFNERWRENMQTNEKQSWFKRLTSTVKEKFSNIKNKIFGKEETLLLNEGTSNQQIDNKNNMSFRDSMRQENFKSELGNLDNKNIEKENNIRESNNRDEER